MERKELYIDVDIIHDNINIALVFFIIYQNIGLEGSWP